MDTDILFLAADPRELTPFLRRCTHVTPAILPVHWARQAQWKGKSILAVANGAGPHRARAAARLPHRVLCNLGFCGALDPALSIGEIVVPDTAVPPHTLLPYTHARLITLTHVVETSAEKAQLHANGHTIVDMEASGLTAPFYSIKAVSDLAGENLNNRFNYSLQDNGRFSLPRLLAAAAAQPFRRFPELIRLAKRTALASENLGAFLDTCTF